MLHRTTIFMLPEHSKELAALGKLKGLQPAQLTRIAIDEFLKRETRKQQ